VGIRYLAGALNASTVRVDLGVFTGLHGRYGEDSVNAGLTTLIKLLRPEIMILDDIDRVEVRGEMLHFLELAQRVCSVVLATANCTDVMMGAALRPGRFDELVRVDRLDPKVLRNLLDGDTDLFERMSNLPVAYVTEYLKRQRVLGREHALAELPELESRAKMIGDRTDKGN
jgi:SpoVK/Ycf46/Vps4 family AAA+-type ATPase